MATGEPSVKPISDLATSEISILVKAIVEYGKLLDTRICKLPDGTLSSVGETCFGHFRDLQKELASSSVEPENLADVAILVSYALGQCLIAAELARELDPLGATEQMQVAIDLLGKAGRYLKIETETGPIALGITARVN